jgi:hypothetical protein
MKMLSYPRQREQLLRHWLHEEEMKLLHFAEASGARPLQQSVASMLSHGSWS